MNPLKLFSLGALCLASVFLVAQQTHGEDAIAAPAPEIEDLEVGTRQFLKLPSGLQISLICEKGKDTIVLTHPKRGAATFSATSEAVTASQELISKEGLTTTLLDLDGDGVPERKISRNGLKNIKVQNIRLIAE